MSWANPTRGSRKQQSGPFDSKAIGNRVKLQNGDHEGEEGVIVAAYREPTFSQMVPWVIEYAVKLDNGEKVYIRREWVRKVKAPVEESVITEASSMSDIGLTPKQVKYIYKATGKAIPHDAEWTPLKTKGQASSALKNRSTLIAVSPMGVAFVRERPRAWSSGHMYVLTTDFAPQFKEKSFYSLKEVFANVPGAGWKWYSSNFNSQRDQGEHLDIEKDRQNDMKEAKADEFAKRLETIYGDRLRKEAALHAEAIKDALIAFATGDEDLGKGGYEWQQDREDKNEVKMGNLRKAMFKLREVTKSPTPFETFSSIHDTMGLGLSGGDKSWDRRALWNFDRHNWRKEMYNRARKFSKNAKIALPRTAKYYLELMRKFRDDAIEAAKADRLQPKEPKLGHVYKAWESYKATGEVNVLSEKVGDECTRCHVPLTHDNVSRHSDEICADCDADMYEPHYDYEDNSDVVSRSEYE
jgi:hypothetical protein